MSEHELKASGNPIPGDLNCSKEFGRLLPPKRGTLNKGGYREKERERVGCFLGVVREL